MPDDDTSTVLEMYKTAVEMADRVSARRAGANSFFVTLNTALAAVVGIVSAARKAPPQGNVPSFDSFGLGLTALSGVVFAVVWWALLRYYRRLSKAKWDVINKLEERLPVAPFTDEWKLFRPEDMGDQSKRNWWQRHVRHREATVVEQFVPFIFVAIYIALAIRVIVQ